MENQLIEVLKERFEMNPHRHENVDWNSLLKVLDDKNLKIISNMEESGGEPDLVVLKDGLWIYVDCSSESPSKRRSFCFDEKALNDRKKNKPESSVEAENKKIGTRLLDEALYRELQSIEAFDLKTSSWIVTPSEIRDLGGALFCDRRYNTVFTYHNGADSYYSARGYRSYIKIKQG